MPIHPLAGNFQGAVSAARTVGTAELIELTGNAQATVGCYGPVASLPEAFYLIAMQREGRCSLCQSGRTALLAPGDATVYASGLPYQQTAHTDFRQTVLMLPAAPLRLACPAIDQQIASTINGQFTHLLATMADSHFSMRYDELPRQVARHASNALQDTVAACVLAASRLAEPRHSQISQYHLNRIRQYALANLGNAELSVASVAAALDISVAHLHRLFSEEKQTFSHWLWEMRLEACHAALRDEDNARQSISQIAFRYGFNQAAHFSRAFRARYGMTASAWRSGQG